MIQCSFLQNPETSHCVGFTFSGHALAAEYGHDPVCAAVSSAVYLTANAVTDVLHIPAEIEQRDDFLHLRVQEKDELPCRPFFAALRMHLENLRDEYPKNINVSDKRCKIC